MRTALDTNAYIHFSKGDPATVECIQKSERIFLTFITVAELRAGFVCGAQSRQNEQTFIRFLNSSRVSILFADDQTTHHYARLFKQLRQQGTPIPTNDIWIAALVAQHDLLLCTTDKHFDRLPQIPRA